MLVLTRQAWDASERRIRVRGPDGTTIWIELIKVDRGRIRLGVAAPKEWDIAREELLPAEEKYERRKAS